ncbi:MAG: 6-bladed beta-propeller [Chromatiales bacterium]|nr:6-bladed beta-propeller [Chromatiales bacterium]
MLLPPNPPISKKEPVLSIKHIYPNKLAGSWRRQLLTIDGVGFTPGSVAELCWPAKCVILDGDRIKLNTPQRVTISLTTGVKDEIWRVTLIDAQGHRSNTLKFEVYIPGENSLSQSSSKQVLQPDIPRYRFVGEIYGESNYGIQKKEPSFFKKVVGLVTGETKLFTLQRPQSGYTDESGTIYVTDISHQAVVVFAPKGVKPILWKRIDNADGRFKAPVAITRGQKNEFLITDAELAIVVRLDSKGKPLGIIGKGILKRPTGIAYDRKNGHIYVADTQAHAVKVFDNKFRLIQTIGERGESPGQFNYPTHINFSHNRLYVTDTMNSRVQIFDAEGKYLKSFGKRGINKGDIPRPKGITTDGDGNIYVIESYYDHLLIYNKEGQFLLPIGGTGKGIGEFYLPAGVWSDSLDRIYIADMFNGRIVVLQFLGESNE